MSQACYCADNKERKPVIISISGGKDEITGRNREIEIVICPHRKDEQPCGCGGQPSDECKPISSNAKEPPKATSQKDNGSQGAKPPSSGNAAAADNQKPKNTKPAATPPQTAPDGARPQTSAASSQPSTEKTRQMEGDDIGEDFTKLPVVSPRYHGPGCVLEVTVLEKHEDSCQFKKLPNDKRNDVDDKIGFYEVVGRMVFKTCNYAAKGGDGGSSTGSSSTVVGMAQLIPMMQIPNFDGKFVNKTSSFSVHGVTNSMQNITDNCSNEIIQDTSTYHVKIPEQYPPTVSASIQTPLLVSKEIGTDEDIEYIYSNYSNKSDKKSSEYSTNRSSRKQGVRTKDTRWPCDSDVREQSSPHRFISLFKGKPQGTDDNAESLDRTHYEVRRHKRM